MLALPLISRPALDPGGKTMLKKLIALLAALAIPLLTFWLIMLLNDSGSRKQEVEQKVVNFDVEKQKRIEKPKPKPPEQKQRKQPVQAMPSLKPGLSNDALGLDGLSFGVPQFNETEFAGLDDNSLLDSDSSNKKNRTVDTKPKVVKRSPIVYPELARKQGISGYVTMNVLIDENGSVTDVKIVDAKPTDIFELKAESTIRQWKFEPATYNGRKVQAWALQKIVFKLD